MALTISLEARAADRAEALVDGQRLAEFDPRVLLDEQPLHLDAQRQVAPEQYGQRLLAILGRPALLALLEQVPRAPHPDSCVVLRLADPQLAAIPWEYLHTGAFFVAQEHFLLREVAVAPALLPSMPDPALPWRLVVMASDPLLQEVRDEQNMLRGHAPLPRLRVVSELDALRDGLRAQQPPPPLRWQRIAPDRNALMNLAASEPILFHYTGHGSVVDGQPVLCFDDGAGTMRPQVARSLAADLRGRSYFAFLNACRTADSAEPGANLALALVQGGIPAVLGMQTRIADEGAALLAETFYQQLVAGRPLEEALWRARQRLEHSFGADPTMWGIPALYRAAGYRLPQQAYAGPPPAPVEPPEPQTKSLQAPARLLGRAVELTELMRLFVFERKQVITIRGPGGMGKTALVHELAMRLRFHFRDGIFAVTLAPAGEQAELSAATLRAELARRLGLHHPAFDDPAAADQQEEAIVGAVHGRRALLIFDNYETVLASLGHDPADLAAQEQPAGVAGLATLRQMLVAHFRDGELRDLCFDIGIDYESLPGEGKSDKARELILACGRSGKLAALLAQCTQLRPAIAGWPRPEAGDAALDAFQHELPGQASPSRYEEASAIQRLVVRLARDDAYLLFTTRQAPVDLPGEVYYPAAEQGEQLGGLDQASAIALFRQRAGDRRYGEAFPEQIAHDVGYSPLAIQLAASRWARSQQTEGEFLTNLHAELLQAEQAGEPFHRRSVLVNAGLSIDALAPEMQQALYELALVANPTITPLHAAVVWGLEDEQQWFSDQAHAQLEQLQDRSLLQGVDARDQEHDRALAYTFQPVIAQVLRARAEAHDLGAARERYAAWAAQMIGRAYGEGGIDYSEEVARRTEFYLPDLVAALRASLGGLSGSPGTDR